MACYIFGLGSIAPPDNKASWICTEWPGEALLLKAPPRTMADIPYEHALLCVVEHAAWDAVAVILTPEDLRRFKYDVVGNTSWLLLPKQVVRQYVEPGYLNESALR